MDFNIYVSAPEGKIKKGCNALHNACAYGNIKKVKELLFKRNYNFYQLSSNFYKVTALHYALYNKRLNIADILLEAYKIDLDVIKEIKVQSGEKVLLAFGDQVDKVIAIGSKVSKVNWIPVLLKRDNSVKPDVVYIPDKPKSRQDNLIPLKRELTMNGFCDLNVQMAGDGDSLMHIAVYFKMYSMVERLIELGADYKLKLYDQSPLVYACYQADIKMMEILCKDGTDYWQTSNNVNLAMITALSGSFKTFKFILEKMIKSAKDMTRDECLRFFFNSLEPSGYYGVKQTFVQTVFQYNERFPFLFQCLTKYRKYIDTGITDVVGDTIMHHAAERYIQDYAIPCLKKLIKMNKPTLLLANNSGALPVHVAAVYCRNMEIFKLFYYGTECDFFKDFDLAMKTIATAINEHNTEIVRFLIAEHPDILTKGAPYLSSMMINNEMMIDELLAAGVDPNIVVNGTNAFIQAASYMNDKVLNKFLQTNRVTDVNFADIEGQTVLSYICKWGPEDIFDKWMSFGPDPFIVDNQGNTCLHHAAANSNSIIVKKLIDLGVDPLKRNKYSDTAIMQAICCNNIETFQVLFNDKNHLDLHCRNQNGDTLLHLAASLFESPIFDEILASGIDINAKNSNGDTTLHKTYFIGNFKKLLDQNADYNLKNENGDSVLSSSVVNYQLDKALHLLKTKDDLDLTSENKCGSSFLKLLSMSYFYKEYVAVLKHSKYDQLFSQFTAKCIPCMEMSNRTMVNLFIRKIKIPVLSALLVYLVENNYLDEVKKGIKRGADVNQVNTDHLHGTCLNCAVFQGSFEFIEELLKLGCLIDLPNHNGVVPLQVAMMRGDYDIIDLLLKNNASTAKLDLTTINKEVLEYFNYLFE